MIYALSRAFSVRAAWAFLIAVEVLGREATLGEEGFIGSGGGARSGSELSHLEIAVLAFCEDDRKDDLHGNNGSASI